ncbi:hypothetical protein [Pseudomonas sp. A014]|uniref:hypothetical protein n=1 Tax=Pseudomonas sp. A014 TaxID=3458058 RepID=UPI0040368B98
MNILRSIQWLEVKLDVIVLGADGINPCSPRIHFAFSKLDYKIHGYKIFLSERPKNPIMNLYSCAPLSKVLSLVEPNASNIDDSAIESGHVRLAEKFYAANRDWLESEFGYQFYSWPFWASGSKANIYTASLSDLEVIVTCCLRRINRSRG